MIRTLYRCLLVVLFFGILFFLKPSTVSAQNDLSGTVVVRENCTGEETALAGTTINATNTSGLTRLALANEIGGWNIQMPVGSGTVTIEDAPYPTKYMAMFNGNPPPFTYCSSSSVPFNFLNPSGGSQTINFVLGIAVEVPTSTPLPSPTPNPCTSCTGVNSCLAHSCGNSCDLLGACSYIVPPTATPVPEWECPGGYAQQCIVDAASCSEMRINNCGICGGVNDCCCTSIIGGGPCGNGIVDPGETCSTCESDVGPCVQPPTPTIPAGITMRTLTGILFIDGAEGTPNQQDVGEACYNQSATIRIEDVDNSSYVYEAVAIVPEGSQCSTYSREVPNGRTYRISVTGLSNYQVTGWNNGQGMSSTTLPAIISLQ